jgi:hypothetical protein
MVLPVDRPCTLAIREIGERANARGVDALLHGGPAIVAPRRRFVGAFSVGSTVGGCRARNHLKLPFRVAT